MADGGSGADWSLPGFELGHRLGVGGTGEVWSARQLGSGEMVALKRLRPDADPSAVEALHREVAVLRTLQTPYLVRLRDVVDAGAGPVLVLDLAAGGSLAALLIRRGSLAAGEVVTVAAPLASALAVAHARGLVHGDVTPANVLFNDDGMPMLADLGTGQLTGPRSDALAATAEYLDPAVAAGAEAGPAADVYGLAAVCHHMLAGSPPHEGEQVEQVLAAADAGARAPLGLLAPTAPRALVGAVEAGLAHDPAQRPDAAAFASALRRSHAAAPVRFDGRPAAAVPPPPRPTHAVPRHAAPPAASARRRPPRRVVLAVGAALILVLAAALGWLSGRATETLAALTPLSAQAAPASAPAPANPSSAALPAAAAPVDVNADPDWAALLERLDEARARAFATADASVLAAVYADGSPGLAADTELVRRLAEIGHRGLGVRHTVRSVVPQERSADRAVLRVVDVLAGYEIRAADGSTAARVPPRAEATFVVELSRGAGGWQLVQVRPA